MNHRSHRRFSAGPVIGGRPGNSGGGRDTAKERYHHITNALPHQLTVGTVAFTGHAIQHHGTEQGFDGPQHGDGEGGRNQLPEQVPGQADRASVGPGLLPGPGEFR